MPLSYPSAVVQMANGGATDYRIFVAASTGFFAVEDSAGQIDLYPAGRQQAIPADEAIAFWSCADASDPTPTGAITVLGCRGLELRSLDVREQTALRTLDCSRNLLTDLDLSGLTTLENLYFNDNPLTAADISPCHSLTFLKCASCQLGSRGIPASESNLACHDGPFSFLLPSRATDLTETTIHSRCAAKYISPRIRRLTPEEAEIRAIAYALKVPTPEAIAVAAPAMAALISGPCWLVPIPASTGSVEANLALARAIAELVPGARVKLAVTRKCPVESSTARRRRHLTGLMPQEHHFIRTCAPLNPLPLFFVDNVITTGNTIRAARAVLGWGTGLAYADASTPFNNRLAQTAGRTHPAPRQPISCPAL